MIRNRWYPVLEATRLRRKPVGIRRLGSSFVLWRDKGGKPCALPSTCPHRGAGLHLGRVVGGEIECPWHGFRFGADGRCKAVPCAGAQDPVAHTLDLTPISIAEEHGLIWMWHGSPEKATARVPFFTEVGAPRGTSQGSYILPYHYSKIVETNLDVHHTPFVHRWSIPGVGARVVDFEATVNGDRISTRGQLKKEGRAKGMAFRADALLPCLGFLELTARLHLVTAATPVDEKNTWVWFRYYQAYSNLPVLRRLLSWIAVQLELRIVQPQDWRIFASLPPGTIDDVPVHYVQADQGIALYRKLRRQILDEQELS